MERKLESVWDSLSGEFDEMLSEDTVRVRVTDQLDRMDESGY
jgi:hypothetical protein